MRNWSLVFGYGCVLQRWVEDEVEVEVYWIV